MNCRLIFWILLILVSVPYAIPEPVRGEASSNNSSADGRLQSMNVIDIGFRPETNGFRFANYGDNIPTVGLTPVEMQRMFGDRVVAGLGDGKPILGFPAVRWMNEANKAMSAGHCEGMAVLSALMYHNRVSPSSFGNKAAADLSLKNELLQREIAYWWTTQVTRPGSAIKVNASPNEVLDTLAGAFQNGRGAGELWVMGIYMPDGSGGHSVTPFAVQKMNNDTANILIYDNNFPWETRVIKIDRKANTWKYDGSTNPNEPTELYSGNASTQSLEIVFVSSRLVKQECDFCDEGNNTTLNKAKGSLPEERHVQVWVNGKGIFFITDEMGRRIGTIDSGEFVNEIPDAKRLKLKFAGRGCTDVYEVNLNGESIIDLGEGIEGVWSFFPGLSLGVYNLGRSGTVELSTSETGDLKVFSKLDSAAIALSGDMDTELGPLPADSTVEIMAGTNILTANLGTPGTITLKRSSIGNDGLVEAFKELKDAKTLVFDGSEVTVTFSDGRVEIYKLTFSKASGQNSNVAYRIVTLNLPCACSP